MEITRECITGTKCMSPTGSTLTLLSSHILALFTNEPPLFHSAAVFNNHDFYNIMPPTWNKNESQYPLRSASSQALSG